jgi:hypothetical protein
MLVDLMLKSDGIIPAITAEFHCYRFCHPNTYGAAKYHMRDLINLLESVTKMEIDSVLKKNGYTDIKVNGNTLGVMVQIPDGAKKDAFRKSILDNLLVILQKSFPENNPTISSDPRLSSIGGIVFSDSPVKVLVKDLGIQGDQSAGVANEVEMASMLQSVIEKYGSANVTFVDPRGKSLVIKDCTSVNVAGRDTANSKKADVVLSSPKSSLPISIKKLNAEAWESADNLFGSKAREIIDKLVDDGLVQLKKLDKTRDGEPVYALSKEIVIEPTEQEAVRAIFGSDLNPKGGVVIQTFKPEHFSQKGNDVTVECHAVITSKEDIPESHLMVWLLRNDSNRNSKALGLAGIRIMGVTLSRGIGKSGNKDVILVDQDGNVVERPAADLTMNHSDNPDADTLDAVISKPRLTGPGAKAARTKHEPRMDKATLGRNYKG